MNKHAKISGSSHDLDACPLAEADDKHKEAHYFLPEDPQAEEPGKTQPNGQTENSPKPSKAKQIEWTPS